MEINRVYFVFSQECIYTAIIADLAMYHFASVISVRLFYSQFRSFPQSLWRFDTLGVYEFEKLCSKN